MTECGVRPGLTRLADPVGYQVHRQTVAATTAEEQTVAPPRSFCIWYNRGGSRGEKGTAKATLSRRTAKKGRGRRGTVQSKKTAQTDQARTDGSAVIFGETTELPPI